MAALPPLSALGPPLDGELRDPTLEELFTAPARALPDEIQELPAEDTACTFCGVSYFVFAEVQTLQNTVKQYKKTFRQFVQFMECERQEAKILRQNVTELKSRFSQLVVSCSATTKQLAEQSEEHHKASKETLEQLQKIQQELLETQSASRELQLLSKRNEDGLKMAGLLTEQKLRNEILHLSGQVENCKLMSESQQAAFTAEQDRGRQTIRDLETKLAESQADWTAAERQIVNERDILKQKLLTTTERVDQEVATAQKLQTELTAIREELTRVVNASEAEHKSSSQMNSEIIQLKHQLQGHEKSRVQLLSENGRFKEERDKNQEELTAIRRRADYLQGQLAVASSSVEKVKNDYAYEAKQRAEAAKAAGPQSQLAWQNKSLGARNRHDEVSSNQDCHDSDNEKLIEQLQLTVKQKDREISLLQQTVHRECLERTSLLDRLRSGKVLPEMCTLSNAMVAVNPVSGELAYAAGCIVVIYNLRRNKQVRYYRVDKCVACLCFSPNGQFLAIGEKGYLPAITIWDGTDGTLCAELQRHQYGVACMAFSKDGRFLLTAGLVHDQHLYAWELTLKQKETSRRYEVTAAGCAVVEDKILAADYCEAGNFFVTVGERHFKVRQDRYAGDYNVLLY
ncbi:hypothetical protein BBJ29_000193 [Phytophthora kernoviae]|uniref:Autophagy-related protein 16 domain-containing protein n=1 Tax=Phytophthora kernoviae TaxID=325452 RepID=A0A3F2S3J6_9STRA|nr:hypothetical protein BBJ29_000193 [Phytophthora kernoviae]RLN69505.1 hypothetical protein BBP00_00000336 [Phytophthora kernoviae]